MYAFVTLAATGELQAAIEHPPVALAPAEKLLDNETLTTAYYINAVLSVWQGHWERARGFSDQALVLRSGEPRLLSQRALLECEL